MCNVTLPLPLFVTLDTKVETQCVSFTLQQQFHDKYKTLPGNHEEKDMLRTCEFSLQSLPVEFMVLFSKKKIYIYLHLNLQLKVAEHFAECIALRLLSTLLFSN